MSKRPDQTIELKLADTGTELWPAVEAAQYARLITHEPPASAAEEAAIARFLEAFATCAETWEELQAARRAGAPGGLRARVDAGPGRGLLVLGAAIAAALAEAGRRVTMPLAVVTISRTNLPEARVRLPDELEVTSDRGPTTH